jgi:hypothetical protein
MTPKPGAYRAYLPDNLKHVRLARTDCPMTGVVRRPDVVPALLEAFDARQGDEVAAHYAESLRAGRHVPIIEVSGPEKVWAPGELFLRS